MKSAHEMVRRTIREMSAEGQAEVKAKRMYPRLLKYALIIRHKDFKDMQAQEKVSYFNAKTVSRNTHEMQVGDIVVHYNAVFRLTSRKDWPLEANENPDWQGHCVTFTTELIEWKEGTMPKHWAQDWTFQGNKLARWAVVSK